MPRRDIRSELETELAMHEFRLIANIVLLTLPLWSGVALVILPIWGGPAWWRSQGSNSALIGVVFVLGPLLGSVPILTARRMSIGRKVVYTIAYMLVAVLVLFFFFVLSVGVGGF